MIQVQYYFDRYWWCPSLGSLNLLMVVFTILEYPWKCPGSSSRNHYGSSRKDKRRHSYSDIYARYINFSLLQLSEFSLEKTCLSLQWFHELSEMLSVLYRNNWKVKWKDKRWTWNAFLPCSEVNIWQVSITRGKIEKEIYISMHVWNKTKQNKHTNPQKTENQTRYLNEIKELYKSQNMGIYL